MTLERNFTWENADTDAVVPLLGWGYFTAALRGEAPREFSRKTVEEYLSQRPCAEQLAPRLERLASRVAKWLEAHATGKREDTGDLEAGVAPSRSYRQIVESIFKTS